jgi:colanic acid/amylovoran biosynthesis glycosyltransferase
MKIAFIVTEFPKLSETPILNQITGLLDRAHEVDIYAEARAPESRIHPDVEKYRLLERTYYPVIPRNKYRRLLKGVGIVLANSHRYPRAILNALNVFQFGREALLLNRLYGVAPFLGHDPYDIVHCQFGPNGNKAIFLKEIGAISGKLITTFRGYDMHERPNRFGKSTYERLFEEGDLFLVVSQWGKSRLIELGCEEKKILVLHSGIDCGRFAFAIRQPHVNGQIRLVTIARLIEVKGVQYSILAVAKLAKLNLSIKYSIIGDGPLREELQKLVYRLNVGNVIEFLGEKQQHEVIEILNNAHILLASSITDKDGRQDALPNVLKEAMASGLPVISTQYSGIAELVENGVSGFLVPEKDVDSLAEKLSYLLRHPELWPDLGRAGRKRVEEQYDIERLNDQLVIIYQRLLNHGFE